MTEPRQPPAAWTGPRAVAAVAAGGALGALARFGVDRLVPRPGDLPAGTLVVNVLGCVLMGLLVAAILRRPDVHPVMRPFLAVGLLGGFTTFSTYAAEIRAALVEGRLVLGVAYALGTVILCVAGAALGVTLGMRRSGTPDETAHPDEDPS